MKYTTKSGLELPPEVVEVIEQEQARQKLHKDDFKITNYGFFWNHTANSKVWSDIYFYDDFTEFYKLYPKKYLDSYGNEIHKGETVYVGNSQNELQENKPREFVCVAEKSTERKYICYHEDYSTAYAYLFSRKITEKPSLKSELQSQMKDLKAQVKEIEAKINEL